MNQYIVLKEFNYKKNQNAAMAKSGSMVDGADFKEANLKDLLRRGYLDTTKQVQMELPLEMAAENKAVVPKYVDKHVKKNAPKE